MIQSPWTCRTKISNIYIVGTFDTLTCFQFRKMRNAQMNYNRYFSFPIVESYQPLNIITNLSISKVLTLTQNSIQKPGLTPHWPAPLSSSLSCWTLPWCCCHCTRPRPPSSHRITCPGHVSDTCQSHVCHRMVVTIVRSFISLILLLIGIMISRCFM